MLKCYNETVKQWNNFKTLSFRTMMNQMSNDESKEINSEFKIREVQEKDMQQICDLHARCWKENFKWIIEKNHLDWFWKNPIKWWWFIKEKNLDEYSMFVYDRWGKITWFIDWWFWEKEWFDFEIYWFYVDPNIQREWIWRKLWECFLDSKNFKDKKSFYLRTLKDNEVWWNFYKKMWGEIIDEMKKKFGNKEYDLVCYARKK